MFKKGNALVPTWVAISVVRLLERHLPGLVDYEFTAGMEDELDAISRGELGHVEYLRRFYFGNGDPGLKGCSRAKSTRSTLARCARSRSGRPKAKSRSSSGSAAMGRISSGAKAGAPRCPRTCTPDELSLERARSRSCAKELGRRSRSACIRRTGQPVFVKTGRYGPYVQLGERRRRQAEAGVSLKGMQPQTLDLETAVRLLSLPREVGRDPNTGETIEAHVGRYGQYVRRGKETRRCRPTCRRST